MSRPKPTPPRRLAAIMEDIDMALSANHATTQEVIEAARQMAVSAAAQMVADCPGCNRAAVIEAIVADLKSALSVRLMLGGCAVGEA